VDVRWDGAFEWYEGIVDDVSEGSIIVRYSDDSTETLSPKEHLFYLAENRCCEKDCLAETKRIFDDLLKPPSLEITEEVHNPKPQLSNPPQEAITVKREPTHRSHGIPSSIPKKIPKKIPVKQNYPFQHKAPTFGNHITKNQAECAPYLIECLNAADTRLKKETISNLHAQPYTLLSHEARMRQQLMAETNEELKYDIKHYLPEQKIFDLNAQFRNEGVIVEEKDRFKTAGQTYIAARIVCLPCKFQNEENVYFAQGLMTIKNSALSLKNHCRPTPSVKFRKHALNLQRWKDAGKPGILPE